MQSRGQHVYFLGKLQCEGDPSGTQRSCCKSGSSYLKSPHTAKGRVIKMGHTSSLIFPITVNTKRRPGHTPKHELGRYVREWMILWSNRNHPLHIPYLIFHIKPDWHQAIYQLGLIYQERELMWKFFSKYGIIYPCSKDRCCQHTTALGPQQFCRDGRFPMYRQRKSRDTENPAISSFSLDRADEFTRDTPINQGGGASPASVTPSPLGWDHMTLRTRRKEDQWDIHLPCFMFNPQTMQIN